MLIRLLPLLLLAWAVLSEEWYVPGSHLISDLEFKEKVLEERTTYKIVKFFTPHCVYCRYLKNTFDKLKAEKQWSFEFYDLNCQWYPRLCGQELQIHSFPYTAVYDQNGKLDAQVVGYYPDSVIRDIFEKVEAATLELKGQSANNLQPDTEEQAPEEPQQHNSQNQQSSLTNNQQTNSEDKSNKQNQNNPGPAKREVKTESEAHQQAKPYLAEAHLTGVYQHIFFAICILLGVVYFGSFMHLTKSPNTRAKLNPESAAHSSKLHHPSSHNYDLQ